MTHAKYSGSLWCQSSLRRNGSHPFTHTLHLPSLLHFTSLWRDYTFEQHNAVIVHWTGASPRGRFVEVNMMLSHLSAFFQLFASLNCYCLKVEGRLCQWTWINYLSLSTRSVYIFFVALLPHVVAVCWLHLHIKHWKDEVQATVIIMVINWNKTLIRKFPHSHCSFYKR